MKFIKVLLSIILCLLSDFIVLFSTIYFIVLNPYYLMSRYKVYRTAQALKISETDLREIVINLSNYLRGFSSLENKEYLINNKTLLFYQLEDLIHLNDVNHFISVLKIMCIIFVIISVLLLLYFIKSKYFSYARNGFIIGNLILLALILFIGISAATNLDLTIRIGHSLFATNKYWILSSAFSRLIRLCPEKLFIDAGIITGVVLLSYMILSTTILNIFTRLQHHR